MLQLIAPINLQAHRLKRMFFLVLFFVFHKKEVSFVEKQKLRSFGN